MGYKLATDSDVSSNKLWKIVYGSFENTLQKDVINLRFSIYGRDRFASFGRGISSAGSRIVAHETIDQTETGRRWLTMFTFLRMQLKYKNG